MQLDLSKEPKKVTNHITSKLKSSEKSGLNLSKEFLQHCRYPFTTIDERKTELSTYFNKSKMYNFDL